MEGVTVEQAQALVLEHTPVITETEKKDFPDALHRILAEDMTTSFDNPPFDRSPVDGYACRAQDLAGASKDTPVTLSVTEEIDAGQYSERKIKPGEAVRIMTGAAIPPCCDCCIRQEDTDYGEDTVKIYHPAKQWENYCFAGEDFKKGSTLLDKGTKIGYVEEAIMAGMGVGCIPVYRKPRIAILTTGDEVVEPGQTLPPGKIYNSNQTMVTARLLELGIRPYYIASIKDDPAVMAETLRSLAKKVDMVITTGGVSVGKKDIMHEALRLVGAERIFWRMLAKPGMPTLVSVYQGILVISLSGNPFGVAVTLELLIRPAICKMTQDDTLRLVRVRGVMADAFDKPIHGRRFVRAVWENGVFHLPKGLHSNGVLSSMAGCNCLLDLTEETSGLQPGVEVEAILL